jgi:peptidoglycan hydrolase CwlO-like protein
MDKDLLIRYSPIAVVVIFLILQWNLFVTPVQQEKLHREILQEVSQLYVTQKEYALQQSQIQTMAMQISKIYDKMFAK